MTKFVGAALRGFDFSSPADEAISARVHSDSVPRIRIDAGGRITWGSGSSTGDVNLYRDSENVLTTDDLFKATGGLVTITSSGAPTHLSPNGSLAVDITNHIFYFRSNDTWNQVTNGGGNAVVTVSSSAPGSPEEGNLWFDIDVAVLYIYTTADGWVSVSGSLTLDGLSDVAISYPTTGQVLAYNGSSWVNQNASSGGYIDGGVAATVYDNPSSNIDGGAAA